MLPETVFVPGLLELGSAVLACNCRFLQPRHEEPLKIFENLHRT
jgi:hypothetical protein